MNIEKPEDLKDTLAGTILAITAIIEGVAEADKASGDAIKARLLKLKSGAPLRLPPASQSVIDSILCCTD